MSFAKSGQRGNIRKREREKDDSDDDGGSSVIRKEKAPVKSVLSTSTVGQKSKGDNFYESARTVVPTIGKDYSATAPSAEELEELEGKGSAKVGTTVGGEDGGKLYRGEANRQKLIEKREVIDKKSNSIGPIKAPTNVRMTCRFDYQPDLCKDWKETGYCGFGDSCKFMHDRGDYKAGWELERDWNAHQEKLKLEAAVREMDGEAPVEVDDGLPFACAICRGPFNDPVETKCLHYFCSSCALTNYAKSKRCFICNQQTHGQFNTATKLMNKLNKYRKKDEGKGAEDNAGEDEDADDGFSSWKEEEQRTAAQGWQIPGNTFAEGKPL